MNSKQRVLMTLEHEEADRVPVGEWGIDHDTVEKVIGRQSYWRNRKRTPLALWTGKRNQVVESYKKDLVELVEKLGHDLVPVHFVPPKDLPPEKIKQIDENTYEDQQGRIYKYSAANDDLFCVLDPTGRNLSSSAEVRDYFESEYVPTQGFKITKKTGTGYELELMDESQLELVRYVADKLGGKKFIFARAFSEFAVPFGKTKEDSFLAVALQPELVKEFFELATELDIVKAKIMIAEGVDAIMPGGDFADSSGPMISPESIRKIFLPGMKKLSDYGHKAGVRVMSHNCGNNWKLMDILIEAGYECYQSIACKTADMDLKRLKEKYGDKMAFWGGINIETLVAGTPEENRRDVLYALQYAAPGGGLILGTSNSVVYGSSYENYIAALDTLRKYGKYPIQIRA